MENQFAQLVQKSADLNWCVQIYCTTCGAMDFRNSLAEISQNDGSKLVEILSELDIEEFTQLQNWGECLRLAFYDLRFPFLQTEILTEWLPKINDNIRFTDWILFYVVRYLPDNNEVRNAWISKCADLAVESQDESSIESLIWTLRADLPKFKELSEIVKRLSSNSPKIKRTIVTTSIV
ncbi:MAG: hypothetical protein H0W58_04410 [Acidobacteria bacterium]|jgi:hypothetical protein|nr:hypothetical protein [Acidobacteriota bacterium]